MSVVHEDSWLVHQDWRTTSEPCGVEAQQRCERFLFREAAPANALAFTSSQGITYPSFNDPGYAIVTQIAQVVPVHDTPTTVVIDKTGHVVGTIIGAATYSELTTLLRDAAVTQ